MNRQKQFREDICENSQKNICPRSCWLRGHDVGVVVDYADTVHVSVVVDSADTW